MKKIFFLAGICVLLCLQMGGEIVSAGQIKKAKAAEIEREEEDGKLPDLDYREAENVMDSLLESNQFSLGEYIQGILNGTESFSLDSLLSCIREEVKEGLSREKNQLLSVMIIGIGAALFTNFSNVFKNNQVSDMGFYVSYLLMFSVLAASFYQVSDTAVQVLSGMTEFMRALAPAFFMSVAMASGSGTSLAFYQVSLVVLWLVETVLLKMVLPLIHIYFVIHLANHLMEKDLLSKTTELLEQIVDWSLKTMLGLVAGYNFIQGIIAPAADELKKSGLMRAAAAIPGVGNAIGSVTETVLGAGVLIKNAVGAGGIMALLIFMAGPVVKLFLYLFFYRAGAALIQPVSDKRILECLQGAAGAARMLLFTVCAGGALFLLTIAIVMSATNLRL